MRTATIAGILAILFASLPELSGAVADLSITQSASSPVTTAGEQFTYTLIVQNAGPDRARDVFVTDLLPAAMTLVSFQSDFGNCSQTANTITCHIPALPSGAFARFTMTVDATCPGVYCNFARVTSSDGDLNLSNNTSALCMTVAKPATGADLSVSAVAVPESALIGSNVSYTIRVRNGGPQMATGIRLSATMPEGALFGSASAGFTNAGGTVSWNIPKLGKNVSITKNLVTSTLAAGPICNQVSAYGVEADLVPGNNKVELCAWATTAPQPVHDLAVVKITAPASVVLSTKKPAISKLVSVQIQNRSPQNETITSLDGLVSLKVESLGLSDDLVPELVIGAPQKNLPVTLKPKQTLLVYFRVNFDTNHVNDALKTLGTNPGHEDFRYYAEVHHETIDGQPDTHPADDFGPRSVNPPWDLEPNPDGKVHDPGVGKLKSDRTFGGDILTDLIAPGPSNPTPKPPTNQPPVAVADKAATLTTNAVQIAVLSNDYDPDGDALKVISFSQPAHGAVTFAGNVARYIANAGFVGTDRFNYTISDGNGGQDTAQVSVTVTNLPNHPPLAVNDSATTTTTNAVQIFVLGNDSDPDGDELAVSNFTQPAHGSVSLSTNVARYMASAGFLGTDQFNYTINDGRGGQASAQVTITVSDLPNHPPVAANDFASATGTNAVQIAVLANDSDPDGDTLNVIGFTQPSNGLLRFSGNVATYNANAGFTGTNTFQYTISDGRGGTAPATVSIAVTNPYAWETSEIGSVWSDGFNRATPGSNWVVLGGANVSIIGNELVLDHSDVNLFRQVYYDPWLTSSDQWTIRWHQRFGDLNATSYGVGVGIKNFQVAGGNDRGYNAVLGGVGSGLGRMQIEKWDGGSQQFITSGPAMSLAAGQVVDCSITRSGWTLTATASNRANAQVSTATITFSEAANLIAPTISRVCLYPLGGKVFVDDISFTINHRKPARFIMVGASVNDGYSASTFAKTHLSVMQSNFTETVCNDSSSYNTTSNSVDILPEILAHEPDTAILMIGSNDFGFGYPPGQWQLQYSNLVAQLQAAGVKVKHCFNTPRVADDMRALNNWIASHYPAADVIDTFTPLIVGDYKLNPAYDSGDGSHPNDAGHLLIGQIISNALR